MKSQRYEMREVKVRGIIAGGFIAYGVQGTLAKSDVTGVTGVTRHLILLIYMDICSLHHNQKA